MSSTQYDHLLPITKMHALVFASWQLIQQYSGTAEISFPSRPRPVLFARSLATWQAMGVRHILKDSIGRITQYMDERCLDDKWHLGNLTA